MERLLSESEIADMLSLDVRTLKRWRQHGQGPAWRRLGHPRTGTVRYLMRDVLDFIGPAQHQIPPAAAA